MDLETHAQLASGPSAGNWSELPHDILTSIFVKLGAIEILMGAGLMCHSWLEAMLPDSWRSVDMEHYSSLKINEYDLYHMAQVAIERSCGQLEAFTGKGFVIDEILQYISDRSSTSIKKLGLVSCHAVTKEGFAQFITQCPLLEDLSLEYCEQINAHETYEVTGKACVHLKHFTLAGWCKRGAALGIAAMGNLQNLSLVRIDVENDELAAIIDSCPHLETICAGLRQFCP
ncbi:hypothetical protein PR202_gb28582 [Eleusine coracana subsp. coracana]|uniref:F-box domain-containing protein n=1 Tax=Eleusine coracana subsp. coracana TaxID=191504 RepID=A0AAV5FWS5_ELECO|nr:hypothetical protein PR202_gb28582 [Eleusine coracana subsp. coracana]